MKKLIALLLVACMALALVGFADSAAADAAKADEAIETPLETPEAPMPEDGEEGSDETAEEPMEETVGKTVSLDLGDLDFGAPLDDDMLAGSLKVIRSDNNEEGNTTIEVGDQITLTTTRAGAAYRDHSWSSGDNAVLVIGTGTSANVIGRAEGTAKIRHTYSTSAGRYYEEMTVQVVKPQSVKNIEVYVRAVSSTGELFSQDMFDLLGVSKLGYLGEWFTAGVFSLDMSLLSPNGTANSYIQTAGDWAVIKQALRESYDSSCLAGGTSDANKNNKVGQYIDQIIESINATSGNGSRLLYSTSQTYDFPNRTNNHLHLNLLFATARITYIFGNNGISGETATDGTVAGSKVFIRGAMMDYTPTISAPPGYKIIGYYRDANCTDGNEWNAVNQPINEDTTVYIKIVPQSDAVVNYVVAQGSGTVTNPSSNNAPAQKGFEHFNPVTGSAQGSTAAAAEDWAFDGWYADSACTQKVSDESYYRPAEPDGGWKEDGEYTYYAKFVQVAMSLSVEKLVSGNMGDVTKSFPFTLGNENFTLKNGEKSSAIKVALGQSFTLSESDNKGYTVTVKYGSRDESGNFTGSEIAKNEDGSYTITPELGKDLILVENNKTVIPDTGITLEAAPYVLLLVLCAGGSALLLRRRRQIG